MNEVCALCENDDNRVLYLFNDDIPVCEECIDKMLRQRAVEL